MVAFPFLAVNLILNIIAVLFFVCALALILIVLIQKGRGGGLSAAFGGGMASGILGSKTGDFLTWVTVGLVGMFLLLAVVMAKYYRPTVSDFDAASPTPSRAPGPGGAGTRPPAGGTQPTTAGRPTGYEGSTLPEQPSAPELPAVPEGGSETDESPGANLPGV